MIKFGGFIGWKNFMVQYNLIKTSFKNINDILQVDKHLKKIEGTENYI